MLKREIIEKITKYFQLTEYEAEKIYDDIILNIIGAVKIDYIAELNNLGEFILKADDTGKGKYNNTVEFLLSANLEDELNNMNVSDTTTPEIVEDEVANVESAKEIVPPVIIQETAKATETETIPSIDSEVKATDQLNEVKSSSVNETRVEEKTKSKRSLEDEIKKKRDEIIHELDPQHQESYHPLLHVTEGIPLNVPKPVVLKEPHYTDEIKKEEIKENISETKEEFKEQKTEISEPEKQDIEKEEEEVEEISSKSFSDYFKEVKEDQKISSAIIQPPVSQVIPPAAVELHNEITGEQVARTTESAQDKIQPEVVKQEGNGYIPEAEAKAFDNSYYIWYKDSEPNAVDTQTMSYEYELLYQATKEAEYKSKLRIYVTTFILFFSIVLLLLIFSPVIYKYFFTSSEEQVTLDAPPVTNGEDVKTPATEPPPQQQVEEKNTTQPVTSEQQNQKTPEKNDQGTQTEQPKAQMNIEGLVKTDAGWKDEKTGVLYVQLENGKFTIQESAWNSEFKANQRISKVDTYNISGLSGKFVKVDLGAKGTWYRVRFGEFSTLDEARKKAAELKSKGS